MKQREITEKTKLLDEKGRVANAGYARHLLYIYDKSKVKKRLFSLKEWDFYQIQFGTKVLQMTIGHVSYCASVSANLFDIETGEKRSVGRMAPFPVKLKKQMETDGENPHVLQYLKKGFFIRFETAKDFRRLTLSVSDGGGVRAEADVLLTNCSADKEKTVIAVPFQKRGQFYLNYKENCFDASGYVRIGDMYEKITDGNGLLDWGRGVWPYRHQWTWGNGSTVVDGKHFGFNIGWGFGDTSAATENMFFYDNKAYKLGAVSETKKEDGKIRYADDKGLFVFDVTPAFDNFTRTKILFVDNSCHQVFGSWQGRVKLPDGTTVKVPPFTAFCERADNKW